MADACNIYFSSRGKEPGAKPELDAEGNPVEVRLNRTGIS